MAVPLLDRYVISSALSPTLQIAVGLFVIYTGFVVSLGLALILDGEMPLSAIGVYILARDIIALEVIVPTAVFLGVVVGTTRLHRDREAYAFYSAGVSTSRMTASIFFMALFVALVVAWLTTNGRPWAYQQNDALTRSSSMLSFKTMQPRVFHDLSDGLVLYARSVDRETGELGEVFVSWFDEQETHVVRSRLAHTEILANGDQQVIFTDGYEYRIDADTAADAVVEFDVMGVMLDSSGNVQKPQRRKAKSTEQLLEATAYKDIAELQWRLSLPLVALLLPLLAVRFGRVMPGRQGNNRVWLAFAAYVAIFMLATQLRTAVENEQMAPEPGMFTLPIAMAALLVVLALSDRFRRRG